MLAGRAWRGRRVGSALVAAAIDGARSHGLDKLCLEVFAHNMAAITLYRKSGFLEEGRRTRQYRRASGELRTPLSWGWPCSGQHAHEPATGLG